MAILTLRPTADDSPLALSCSSGSSHYALIDEAAADDSDYVYWTTLDSNYHSDLYALTDHTTETETIDYVNIVARVYGDHNADWGKSVLVKTHGTLYDYAIGGADSWGVQSVSLDTNPYTGSAWTWSEIDDLKVGLSFQYGMCSQLYVEVGHVAIDTFTVTSSFFYGNSVTVTWDTSDATSVSISPTIGATTVDGTIDLYPTSTTTYTITATGGSGATITQSLTATMLAPQIDSFTASPANMEFGSTSNLAWEVTGAVSITIDQSIGNVGSSGTKKVSPEETTKYTLTATNTSGTTYGYCTVTVIPSDDEYSGGSSGAIRTDPEYGRLPQMNHGKSYLEYSSDLTDHYVRSLGYSFPAGEFKRPYISDGYSRMTYLFDDTPIEMSTSIRETALSKVTGETPSRNDMYFDYSQQLASKDNFNKYAKENYRLMGKIMPEASTSMAGAIETIACDVDTHIASGSKATLSVVSPRYIGDKYLWTGRTKTGSGDWGRLSRTTGLSVIYYTPALTANARTVIISLMSGGETLAEIELMAWYNG